MGTESGFVCKSIPWKMDISQIIAQDVIRMLGGGGCVATGSEN